MFIKWASSFVQSVVGCDIYLEEYKYLQILHQVHFSTPFNSCGVCTSERGPWQARSGQVRVMVKGTGGQIQMMVKVFLQRTY